MVVPPEGCVAGVVATGVVATGVVAGVVATGVVAGFVAGGLVAGGLVTGGLVTGGLVTGGVVVPPGLADVPLLPEGVVKLLGTSSPNRSQAYSGHYNSTYFEPLDNVKGDVARICLYVYVRWGSNWGADSITEVFQSVDVLLEWMAIDPVDTWEMGRNAACKCCLS